MASFVTSLVEDTPRVPLIIACLTIALGLVIYFPRLLYPKPFTGPIPYNKSATQTLLGDLPSLLQSPNRSLWFTDQARHHRSPVFQAFLRPLSRPWIVIADYAEAADICTRRTAEFDRSDMTAANFEGTIPGHHVTMKSSDPRLKRNKELIRDLMGPKFLREVCAPKIYDRFEDLWSLWERKRALSSGLSFDASKDIHHAALDVILGIAFGLEGAQDKLTYGEMLRVKKRQFKESCICEFEPIPNPPEFDHFDTLGNSIKIAISSPFPRLHHFLYRNLSNKMSAAIKQSTRIIRAQTVKSIDRAASQCDDDSALSNVLRREKAVAAKEGREPDFHSQTIRSELLGYLIAGHETTSSVFRWGTKYLATHPEVQSRLLSDLHEAYSRAKAENRVPSLQEILSHDTSTPYLDAVVEEIFRLGSPIPIVFRQATLDTRLFDTAIPKGTIVAMVVGGPGVTTPAILQSERHYTKETTVHMPVNKFEDEDIEEFKPERWFTTITGKDGEKRVVFNPESGPAQAFGHGPRSCFGKKLAYLEMRIFFTLLTWRFELLPVEGIKGSFEEEPFLTKVPKYIYVKLIRRGGAER